MDMEKACFHSNQWLSVLYLYQLSTINFLEFTGREIVLREARI